LNAICEVSLSSISSIGGRPHCTTLLGYGYNESSEAFSTCGSRIACFCHSLQLVVCGGLEKFSSCRCALAKVSKLCNIIHQSAVFHAAFEDTFGTGKSIPSSNDTHWNTAYRQIEAVVELDQVKLSNVLNQTSHPNLILTAKLLEMISILSPFTEAIKWM